MKKILNEWRRFLKEDKEDDIRVASRVLAAISPSGRTSKEVEGFLRSNKQRAIRIIRDLIGGSEEIISVSPNEDVAKAGKSQYYFPEKDLFSRLTAALDILEDPRYEFDFSRFDKKTPDITEGLDLLRCLKGETKENSKNITLKHLRI